MSASASRILVFGGGGQLGLDLSRTAGLRGIELAALPRREVDIADATCVANAIAYWRPSAVINAAAYTRVDAAEVEREKAEQANVIGPAAIAKACNQEKIPLIHVSTDYVFDGSQSRAYKETDPVAPIGFYGSTKARGEEAIRQETAQHVILRVSWLFGEYGNNFLKTMLRLASERNEIRVVADQYGCPTSTRDVAGAILRIVPSVLRSEMAFGTFHFAGDGIASWHDFASVAVARYCALAGRNVRVLPIATAEYPTRTRRPAFSALDSSKFEKTFGFRGAPWQREVSEITEILTIKGQA